MRLPTELRLRIYEFAFGDILDDIAADTAKQHPVHVFEGLGEIWKTPTYEEHPVFFGVFGLLHTSRELRRESLDALLAHVEAYKNVCRNHYEIALKAYRTPPNYNTQQKRDDWTRDSRLRKIAFNEADYRRDRVHLIHRAIDYVKFWFDVHGEMASLLTNFKTIMHD